MRTRIVCAVICLSSVILPPSSLAQPPPLIHYQGRLVDGTNLVNDTVSMMFRIHDDPVAVNVLFESTNLVTVVDGLYSTVIGEYVTSGNLDAALDNPAVWLEVIVDGTPLSPRERILAAPYARAVRGLWVGADNAVALHRSGGGNVATEEGATVGGGVNNTASNLFGTVGGGLQNTAGGGSSTVGGGSGNAAIGHQSTVSGGFNNNAGEFRTVVGGGQDNFAGGEYATVGGGQNNSSTGQHSTVAGGRGNQALGSASTVGGGTNNLASGEQSTIGGGGHNTASGSRSFIGGGFTNIASGGVYATVGGGYKNTASADMSTVGGGFINTASDARATVGGGERNVASGTSATVGGGFLNVASGTSATIGGGRENTASGWGATIGGGGNIFELNVAFGDFATIPGGRHNSAEGDDSFAAGRRAKANHQGAFAWGDSTNSDVTSTNANSVTMRAAGGYRFFSNGGMNLGAQLPPNATAWAAISDREAKENIEPIDTAEILDRLAAMPITAWTYKADPNHRRYIGPMAQDFRAAFGLGDDKTISTLDADGVAFAAIQALCEQNRKLKQENEALRERLSRVERTLGL